MNKTFRIIDTPPAEPGSAGYEHNHDRHVRYPFTVVDEVGRDYGSGYPTYTAAERKVTALTYVASLPVGLRSNGLLVDVRAVRTRAITAVVTARRYGFIDAEGEEILADLEAVAARLDRWKNTAHRTKRGGAA